MLFESHGFSPWVGGQLSLYRCFGVVLSISNLLWSLSAILILYSSIYFPFPFHSTNNNLLFHCVAYFFTEKSEEVLYFNNPMWPGDCYFAYGVVFASCIIDLQLWSVRFFSFFFLMFDNWDCKCFYY